MAGNPAIFLSVYSFILLSSVVSIFFLINIIRIIRQNERQENLTFSVILKYYFWMLLTMSILMLIHTSTVLIIWRNDLRFPMTPFFWSGNFDSAFMTIIPFTAFTLTLDRCLIFLLKMKYNRSSTITLFCISIFISIIIGMGNFVMYIVFRYPELPDGCVATGCLVTQPALMFYSYSKAIGVVMNTSVGILFLVIATRLKKELPQIGNKVKAIADAVIFRAVIFGIICDVIPHISSSVWNSVDPTNLLRYVGPFSRVIMAGDLLLNSIMNWIVFTVWPKK